MKYLKPAILAFFLLAGGSGGRLVAQPAPAVETLRIPSRVLKEERTILVSTPETYARGTQRYPILYLTDGDAHLIHTRATVDFLARNGLMPNVIIVGVTNTNRTRDLTPTQPLERRPDGTEQLVPGTGGAEAFLEFFEKELFPAIESKYRTLPCRIFSGHSFGGLLALHIFATRPDWFHGIIAASPSLDWDHDLPFREVQALLATRKELSRTLFVSMANEEVGQRKPTRFDRLCKLLGKGNPAGFVWEGKPMPEEDHGSVVLQSQYWGLRKIFSGWKPTEPFGSLAELKAHYGRLSQRMGFAVSCPEFTANLMGYRLLGLGRQEEALAVFRFNIETYPGSPNAYDSLAEALEKASRLDEALHNYTKAVEIARKVADPQLGIYLRNRERLAAASQK